MIKKIDPILFSLYSLFNKKPILVGLASIIIPLLEIPIAIILGVWQGIDYSLQQSLTTWGGNIVLGFTNYFILKYYILITTSFKEIEKKKVIEDAKVSFSNIIETIVPKSNNTLRYIVFIGISLIISIFFHYTYLLDNLYGWTESSANGGWSILGYINIIYFTIELTIIFNFFFWVSKIIKIFRKLNHDIQTNDLTYNFVRFCSTNSGGLKPFGDLAMNCNTVLFTIGIWSLILFISVSLYHSELLIWQLFQLMLPLPTYVIITPIIYYFHIGPIHEIMIRKKEELINCLVEKDMAVTKFDCVSFEDLFSDSSKLKNIKLNSELFEVVNKFPTWPFNTQTITKLVTYLLLPIIPFLYQIVIPLIL